MKKITLTSLKVARDYDGSYQLVDLYESTEPDLLNEFAKFDTADNKTFMELNFDAGRKYVVIRAYSNIERYADFCDRLNAGIKCILLHNNWKLKCGKTFTCYC